MRRMYRGRDKRRGESCERTITCGVCDMTSYNPNDIEKGYCGNCHAFADETVEGVFFRASAPGGEKVFILNNPAHVERLKQDPDLLEGATEILSRLLSAVEKGEE